MLASGGGGQVTAEVEARLAAMVRAARRRGHPILAPCASRNRLGRDGRRVRWPMASGLAEPAREALPGNTRMRARAPPACGTA
jgi:hypothetical protein